MVGGDSAFCLSFHNVPFRTIGGETPGGPVPHFVLDRDGLGSLITALRGGGRRVVGPVLDSQVVRFAEIESIDDLPAGWTMEVGPGRARAVRRNDDALFGYAAAPNGLKELLFPPHRTLWRATREDGRVRFEACREEPDPTAVIGARPCDLAAASVQDRIFTGSEHQDPDYSARRRDLFVVAVQCTEAAPTCFCTSFGTGPAATAGFDIALTEIVDDTRHIFVAETGSDRGAALLDALPRSPAGTEQLVMARQAVAQAAASIRRRMPTDGLRNLLASQLQAGRWNAIAERCLACSNCTLVCPTCFCVSTEDTRSLDGSDASKVRRWDSCFSLDFSYMGGHPVRASVGARYRHWLTHKLSTWVDQFGTFGCVGCGRCIVWCPVGIDLTEEVAALRATEAIHA